MKILTKAATASLIITMMFSFNIKVRAADNDTKEYTVKPDTDISTVYLGGMPFGVKLYSNELTVVGFTEVETERGPESPAYDAGIRENVLRTFQILSKHATNRTEKKLQSNVKETENQ